MGRRHVKCMLEVKLVSVTNVCTIINLTNNGFIEIINLNVNTHINHFRDVFKL